MKGEQRIENFFAEGTLGAKDGKSLEDVIGRMNTEGWKIDQIVPLSFRPCKFSNGGMEVVSGIILCSFVGV